MPVAAPCRVEDLGPHQHACWMSDTSPENQPRLTGYLATGLSRGERVGFYGASPGQLETVAADLSKAGVAVGELVDRGQLILGSAEDQYLAGADFDPHRQLELYAAAVEASVDEGYQGFRVAADLAWLHGRTEAGRAWPGYELAADLLASRLPFTALCIYEPSLHEQRQLALIEALHSVAVRDCDNPIETGFRLYAQRDGSIRLRGELDLTYAPDVAAALSIAARYSHPGVIDVSGLRFVDAAGLWAIVGACRIMAFGSGGATIRGGSAMFHRIWRLAGFGDSGISLEVN
jgi:anti-anti-sigma factor